jgi:beta-glucanase (GH16 family)
MRRVKALCALLLSMAAAVAGVATAAGGDTPLLGDQVVEGHVDDNAAGSAEAFQFTDATGGTVSSIVVYVDSHNTAKKMVAGLYANNAGHPGKLLASGSRASLLAGAWNTVTVKSAAVVSAGSTYWIAVLGRHGTLYFRDGSSSGCSSESSSQTKLNKLPSSWKSGPDWPTCPISAYAEGTASTPAPTNTAPPQITGTTTQGDTLTTSNGSWNGSPSGYTYAWQDCDASGESCSTISGASSSSYTLAGGDIGHTIVAVVTATNAGGSASAASAATAVVESSTPGVPVDTVQPVVTGTVAAGQTLRTSNGVWSNEPTAFEYQWQDCAADGSGCVNIGGATSSSYTVASSDAGHTITAVVSAGNTKGAGSASASPVPLIDEFNGSGVQTSLWTVMDQQGDTTNGEVECYLPSQVVESGGFLTESLMSDSVTCPAGTPNSSNPAPYVSGAVQMRSVSFTYGTVVVRARMGSGSTGWPAIWLLGASCQQPNWLTEPSYSCGWPSNASDASEIDIAEVKGFSTGAGTVWQNVITSNGTQTCMPATSSTNTNYHTYELEWTATSLTWKIDGTKTCHFTKDIPTKPMFLIINTAQSGASLSETQVTSVDYAHISYGAG